MKASLFMLVMAASAAAHANQGAAVASAGVPSSAPATVEGDADRVICERRRKLGSQRMERVCMTVAQREAAKEKAQQDLQRLGRCSGNDSLCAGSL